MIFSLFDVLGDVVDCADTALLSAMLDGSSDTFLLLEKSQLIDKVVIHARLGQHLGHLHLHLLLDLGLVPLSQTSRTVLVLILWIALFAIYNILPGEN